MVNSPVVGLGYKAISICINSCTDVGQVTEPVLVMLQPVVSDMVTVYVPGANPVRSCVVAPFDHRYVRVPPAVESLK